MLIPEDMASRSPREDRTGGELVLAVDSGGTKTSCTLARMDAEKEWTILGTGRSSAGNPRAIGQDASLKAIAESVRLAKAEAGLDSLPCHRALFAVAGTLHEPIRHALCRHLQELELAEECIVVPDLIPMVLGSGPDVSIGVIAGTGSVAIGRDGQGSCAVAGGWGPLLGDDGSGFAMGRAALRATLRSLETGKRECGLVDQVCQALHVQSALEVKAALASAKDVRELTASLAPIVLSTSADPLSVAIIAKAAADLAEMIQTLQSRLQLSSDQLNVAISGGVLYAGSPLAEQLGQELTAREILAKLTRITDPALPILNMLAQAQLPTHFDILP